VKYYGRYMDDFYIICPDKRILQRMNEYSRDFGVEFDENGGILVN
jgi:hypothetical protein